jgi:tryptophan 2,3-dioxygenase
LQQAGHRKVAHGLRRGEEIQGGHAHHRHVQAESHALDKGQANAQAGERTRPERHPQALNLTRRVTALFEQAVHRWSQLHGVMTARHPARFSQDLAAVIQRQSRPLR